MVPVLTREMYQCLAKIDSSEGNYQLALLHTNMYSEYLKILQQCFYL